MGQASERPVQEMISGPFVRNAWYVAAWQDELREPGRLLARTILGDPVVMFRTSEGGVCALENRCPHRFAPLSLGKVLPGDRLQCAYHGLEFATSGACVLNPHGAKTIPSRAHVASYPIVEKHQAAWIWMGDGHADPARIQDFRELDDVPEPHTTKRDSMKVGANWQLLVDNLLDLSHTAYLHAGVLGNPDTAQAEIAVEPEGDDVLVSRIARGAAPTGLLSPFWPGHPPRMDAFNRIRWMAPSTLKLRAGICEMGAQPETGTGLYAIHLLTPETERSTHYFFTAVRWGVRTIDATVNRELQARIAKLRRYAFEVEDAPVIEAQQRLIEAAPRRLDPMILAIDVGPVRYKHVLARMLQAERHS